jgi:hypothetical protein
MAAKFEEILDVCLQAVLTGDSVDTCCQRYPQAAAKLRPLLDLALKTKVALTIDVPAAAKAMGWEKIMAATAEARLLQPVPRRVRLRLLLKPALVAAAALAALTGTALAATAAGPDSILYPLKQELEDARVAIAAQTLDQAAAEVDRAGKRLDELKSMIDQGKPQYTPDLLARYNAHMNKAEILVEKAAAEGEDTSNVTSMMDATRARHDAILEDISDRVPEVIMPERTHRQSAPVSGSDDRQQGQGREGDGSVAPAGDFGAEDSKNRKENPGMPPTENQAPEKTSKQQPFDVSGSPHQEEHPSEHLSQPSGEPPYKQEQSASSSEMEHQMSPTTSSAPAPASSTARMSR